MDKVVELVGGGSARACKPNGVYQTSRIMLNATLITITKPNGVFQTARIILNATLMWMQAKLRFLDIHNNTYCYLIWILSQKALFGRNQSGCEKAKKVGFLPFIIWVFLTNYIFFALIEFTMCFKHLEASHIMSFDTKDQITGPKDYSAKVN